MNVYILTGWSKVTLHRVVGDGETIPVGVMEFGIIRGPWTNKHFIALTSNT